MTSWIVLAFTLVSCSCPCLLPYRGPAGKTTGYHVPEAAQASVRVGIRAWGRIQETYGDDPHHLGELGAALVRGIQRHAMACVKHYALNNQESSRNSVNAKADERTIREIYLPAFKAAVTEAHVDFSGGLGEWKERWPKAQRQIVTLEEVAQELAEHAFQIGERNVFGDPQAFDLVKHR